MKAWQLLEREGAWTQKAEARNKLGVPVSVYSYDAVKWSTYGALKRVNPSGAHAQIFVLQKALGGSIRAWNDAPERTQAEVVAKLKELDL